MQFPPSPPWSDSEAEDLRKYLFSPAGRRVFEQLRLAKPTSFQLIETRKISADFALGMFHGFEAALSALAELTVPPSDVTPLASDEESNKYPPLEDDAAWTEKPR